MGIVRRCQYGVLALGLAFAATGMACAPGLPHPDPQAPPEGPPVDVSIPLASVCAGAPSDATLTATVPQWVRAGRPFSVSVSVSLSLPVVAYALLDVPGGTTSPISVGLPGNTYVVAAGHTERFPLSVTQIGFGAEQLIDPVVCTPTAPVELASIEVRRPRRTAAMELTTSQLVGLWCVNDARVNFPMGEQVSLTVPSQARAGVPFEITLTGATTAATLGVVGATLDGGTVTPTGPPGSTVEISFVEGTITEFPFIVCNQMGGPVHLATIPIVRH